MNYVEKMYDLRENFFLLTLSDPTDRQVAIEVLNGIKPFSHLRYLNEDQQIDYLEDLIHQLPDDIIVEGLRWGFSDKSFVERFIALFSYPTQDTTSENVLCFDTVFLTHGYPNALDNLSELFNAPLKFMPRSKELENDTRYLQIIPYTQVVVGDKTYTYRRSTKQSDKRLHGEQSLGFGGHVNEDDLVGVATASFHAGSREELHYSIIEKAMCREIEEELGVNPCSTYSTWFFDENLINLVNETNNKVNDHHIGIYIVVELDQKAKVNPNEEILELSLINNDTLEPEEFEAWSKVILDEQRLATVSATKKQVL